jgi:hypothetical protein
VAERTELTDEQRDAMIPSGGQAKYKNRIGWVHDRLKRVDLSESAVDFGMHLRLRLVFDGLGEELSISK